MELIKVTFLTLLPTVPRKWISSSDGTLMITFCPFLQDRNHLVFNKWLSIIIAAMSGKLKLQAFVSPFSVRTYFRLLMILTFHELGWCKGPMPARQYHTKHLVDWWWQPAISAENNLLDLNCNQGSHSQLLPMDSKQHPSLWRGSQAD